MKAPIEVVHDDTLKVESLLRSNERLREEYDVLARRMNALIDRLQLVGGSIRGESEKAHLMLSVSMAVYLTQGKQAAVFDEIP